MKELTSWRCSRACLQLKFRPVVSFAPGWTQPCLWSNPLQCLQLKNWKKIRPRVNSPHLSWPGWNPHVGANSSQMSCFIIRYRVRALFPTVTASFNARRFDLCCCQIWNSKMICVWRSRLEALITVTREIILEKPPFLLWISLLSFFLSLLACFYYTNLLDEMHEKYVKSGRPRVNWILSIHLNLGVEIKL